MPTVGDYYELLGDLVFKGELPPEWVRDRVAELSMSIRDIPRPEFDHLIGENDGVELTARDAEIYLELLRIKQNLPEYIREAKQK